MVLIITPITVFLGILIVALCLAAWVWAFISIRKGGTKRAIGMLAIQLVLVLFFIAVLEGGSPFDGLLVAVLAPLALPFAIDEFWTFGRLAASVAFWTAPVTLLALAFCLARPALREWSLAIPVLLGLMIAHPIAEWQSQRAMCEAASRRGFSEFQRNTFRWSLQNRDDDFDRDYHAIAIADGKLLGWSYREMDWYVILDGARGKVKGPDFDCATML